MMKMCIVFLFISLFLGDSISVMLKKQCPPDELYRSCSFYSEYTCWTSKERKERVKTTPARLVHCMAGCFCKKSFVRAYLGGPCKTVSQCRDNLLTNFMANLPKESLVVGSY